MTNAKLETAARAAAIATVLTFGVLLPEGLGPKAEPATLDEAWKYPESASLASFLQDIVILPRRGERDLDAADRELVMLDQVIRRAVLTVPQDQLAPLPVALGPGLWARKLEFGLGLEAQSGGRFAKPARGLGLDIRVPEVHSALFGSSERNLDPERSLMPARSGLTEALARTTERGNGKRPEKLLGEADQSTNQR